MPGAPRNACRLWYLLALLLVMPGVGHALSSPLSPAVHTGDDAFDRLAFWQQWLALPLPDRVAPAPPALLAHIRTDNLRNGFPAGVRATSGSAALRRDIRSVLAGLPPPVARLLARRLVAVALVRHLGSTGYSDEVLSADGRPVAGYILLDAAALDRRANAWASWKESTPFVPDPAWRLRVTLEEAAQDDRRQAIEYILLHEIGHILAIDSGLTPSWNLKPTAIGRVADWPFLRLSWRVDTTGNYRSLGDGGFALRERVVFYRQPQLPASAMPAVYAQLAASDFPTLYAATNPADDFAESFATYVHVVLEGRPYQVDIFHDGRRVRRYPDCWREPRCQARRRLIESLLRAD